MILIRLTNKYGDLYAKALKANNIVFLFEVYDGYTKIYVKEEDWQKANKVIEGVF